MATINVYGSKWTIDETTTIQQIKAACPNFFKFPGSNHRYTIYLSRLDDYREDEERFGDIAQEVGLEVWGNAVEFDTFDDVLIGVIFYDRPTDHEVETAIAKVAEALASLREKLGEPSSGVEVWRGIYNG